MQWTGNPRVAGSIPALGTIHIAPIHKWKHSFQLVARRGTVGLGQADMGVEAEQLARSLDEPNDCRGGGDSIEEGFEIEPGS